MLLKIVPRPLSRLALSLAVTAFTGLFLTRWIKTLFSNSQPSDTGPSKIPNPVPVDLVPSFCDGLDISRIEFVVKTGATEASLKLPVQLTTSLRCVPTPLIFSDLNQTIGAYQVHDVLAQFSKEAMMNNRDFDIYEQQKILAAQGRQSEMEKLAELPILTYDWRAKGRNAAWALDKYKFLHMIDQAFELQPDKDWYVFIEADTYLSLPNLISFLDTKDCNEKLYFGSAVRMFEHQPELYFAHGGSGFILSRATVEDFTTKYNKLEWDIRTKNEWLGDFLVADALDEVSNVQLTNVSPMMQGDNPLDFPFGEHSWCMPAITLHHVTPEQFHKLFDYEQSRGPTQMLYRDLFALFFDIPFPAQRENWQNSADNGHFEVEFDVNDIMQLPDDLDLTKMMYPNNSLEACRLACTQNSKCLQFSYQGLEDGTHRCHLSSVFIFGHPYEADEMDPVKTITSGWLRERISQWVENHRDCPQ